MFCGDGHVANDCTNPNEQREKKESISNLLLSMNNKTNSIVLKIVTNRRIIIYTVI